MDRIQLQAVITQHPDRGNLPVECVLAICMVESSCRPWAYRYEPAYKYLVGEPANRTPSEMIGQKISWGLMQVMGGVAREHGFVGSFPELCDPPVGLKYGMLHLRKYWAKYQHWPETIVSYNAGHPVTINGQFANQAYLDKVLKYWNFFEHQIPIKESEV